MTSSEPPGTDRFGHGKVDPYGFARPEEFDFKGYERFMSAYLSVLARRAKRWKDTYGDSTDKVPKSRKLKRFCRKGIPGDLRAETWLATSAAVLHQASQPDRYRELRAQTTDVMVLEAIMLDLHRTFPENVYFSDATDPSSLRKPLQHVLEALSVNNPHVGYCQGMNFVCGLLLLVVRSEERVYWLMDTLLRHMLPDYWSSDMIAVQAEQLLLGEVVRWKLPVLHAHLEALGVQWTLVGMKWFICLYADVMPVETVLRIWDCMFLEGSKILLRVALTLITINKDKLMSCSNFPQAMDVFRDIVKDPLTLDCHQFMQNIFSVTGSMPRSKLKSMREKCVRQVIKER